MRRSVYTINAKTAKNRTDDQQNGFRSFEQYLAEEYNYTFDELIGFVLQTVEHFEEIKEKLFVKTDYGTKVKPLVFQNSNMYLQPEALNKIREEIKHLVEILRNVAEDRKQMASNL